MLLIANNSVVGQFEFYHYCHAPSFAHKWQLSTCVLLSPYFPTSLSAMLLSRHRAAIKICHFPEQIANDVSLMRTIFTGDQNKSSKETFVEMRESESRSKINISICQLQIVKNIKSNIIILYSKCTKRLFWQFSRSPKFPVFKSCDNYREYKNCFCIEFFSYFSRKHTWQINAF